MEKNVTSLEVSKKLKEAGFKKKSYLKWCFHHLDKKWIARERPVYQIDDKNLATYNAYQVNEIIAELPKVICDKKGLFNLEILFGNSFINVKYINGKETLANEIMYENGTLQDTLAEMWLWLKDNGYIKGDK
ncbi:MAG: hypothetical protein KAJ48_00090 [Elusimicrobiales bacterium]|nr:hypothetical protein [Elusimicrobiales bacterium]